MMPGEAVSGHSRPVLQTTSAQGKNEDHLDDGRYKSGLSEQPPIDVH